jgi:hypothetical protein
MFTNLLLRCLRPDDRFEISRQKCPREQRGRTFRLGLEMLDDRVVPAVLTINTLADTTDSGLLSVRDAISVVDGGSTSGLPASEVNQVSGTLGQNDTITFAAGLSGTISLTESLPEITAEVQILGPGPSQLTIDGGSLYQIFSVSPSFSLPTIVSFSGLRLENGMSNSGGAIFATGAKGVVNLTVSNLHLYRQSSRPYPRGWRWCHQRQWR